MSEYLSNFISSSDLHNLDPAVPHNISCYVVHPACYNTHVSDEEIRAAAELKNHLHTVSNHVVEDFEPNGFLFYKVYSDDEAMLERLRRHQGVRYIEPYQEHAAHLATRAESPSQTRTWIAFAKAGNDEKTNDDIRKWLDSKVQDQNKIIEVKKKKKNVWFWSGLILSDSDLREARRQNGIESIVQDRKVEGGRAVAKLKNSEGSRERVLAFLGTRAVRIKRAGLNFIKQDSPPKDLVLISQYRGVTSTDFVYEERAGSGIFIYVVDHGVEVDITNRLNRKEFKNSIRNGKGPGEEDFQTSASKMANENPNQDHYENFEGGHGTPVASKALGNLHGIAKEATLISVKTHEDSGSILEALDLILEDLTEYHPERAKKSVVVMAMHLLEPDKTEKSSTLGKQFYGIFGNIMDTGVPIVVSAGNHAQTKGRSKSIDAIPAILEDQNLPLIVVGAAKPDGTPEAYSQGQVGTPKPTIYAPGTVEAQCKNYAGKKNDAVLGTSFAAPAVAGVIATYMNYDPAPWGKTTGKARVSAIKNFIQHDVSSVEQQKGVRMIRNGADEQAHKAAKPIER